MNCSIGPDNILYDTALFREIYNFVGQLLPCWLSYFVAGFVIILILVNAVLLGAAAFSWLERRLIGKFQNRLGPNRWGPFGLLQPIADLIKLLFKEDLTPGTADKIVFFLVPIGMVAPVILVMAVVPFAKNTALANLNVGVLYILAVTSVTSIAIFMAGWSSNNRFALFGAARGVAVLISYEVPVVISLLGVVMVAGSMSLADVVTAQTLPFIIVQPLAFFVFVAGTTARAEQDAFRPGGGRIGTDRRLSHRVQRDQVRFDPGRRVRGRDGGFGGDRHAFPQRMGGSGGALAGMALVPAEDHRRGLGLYLGAGHLPPPAHRPAAGLRLEVPAAGQPDQPSGYLA